jgi:ribosomal protein S18 acetylase RimI-like enzyme
LSAKTAATSLTNYHIRHPTRAELDLVFDWAAAEKWNPGLKDPDCFAACDPAGLFLGVLDGVPIASLAALALDDAFGFISLYLVRPEHRGRGYGLRLWQEGLAYLGSRNIGLDAVAAQQTNYAKSGFRVAYRNLYYLGPAGGTMPAGVAPLTPADFEGVVAYDAAFFSSPRPHFLACWLHQPAGAALGAFNNGRLAGYGVIRPCRKGFKIGPLFADDRALAAKLFQGLCSQAATGPVIINIPEANPQALELAHAHRLRPIFTSARMYTRGEPGAPLPRLYAHDIF